MSELTCPVCDRSGIDRNICPNCETDLSTLRMLAELPIVVPQKSLGSTIKMWLLSIVFAAFTIGISLGAAGGALLSQQPPKSIATAITPTMAINIQPSSPPVESKMTNAYPCTHEFYYTVRHGDSLSKIARQFYGDIQKSQLIIQSNAQLQGRENDIDLDEKILIPKLYQACD
ncbi:LysM peptidoglycan-binding domain-containing protein [Chamaesiphon minutus]|uniref:LysM domain-containing protein n=1 Tax=Chamaesiphon minutus (strain ATCC 27169 / PCC 6605) TaxID=1173020 RepID=K9UJ99_CHAP6|nr:LysM peptidoglycan-binding domain-containing protein [Chamaesiphon minutus]AFY95182.1 LysM domain-containing protein [Chamaesiphon minutus PCC 6605]